MAMVFMLQIFLVPGKIGKWLNIYLDLCRNIIEYRKMAEYFLMNRKMIEYFDIEK